MSFGPPPSIYTQSATSAEAARIKRRRKMLVWPLALLLVAALGTGGWLLWGGESGGSRTKTQANAAESRLDVRETVEKRPASTVGKMAFRFSVVDMSAGEQYEMPGMWATDKILAKGINKTLVGLAIGTDAKPGDEKWKLPLDGPICGYTRHVTGENRTAVLYRANDSEEERAYCDRVAFFDLDDGRKNWSHDFPASATGTRPGAPSNGAVQDTPSVTLVHDTVAVTWGGGTIAYGMDRGEIRWSTKATGACQDAGAAGGGALLVREQCWSNDKSLPPGSWEAISYKVRRVDRATGRTLWSYSAAKGVRDVSVPSSDPVVLAVSAGDTGITELLPFDDDGKNRVTIRLQQGTYVGECSYGSYLVIDYCPTVAVGDNQVFLRIEDDIGVHTSNWVIGFDLATGNTTTKFESGPNALLIPVRMSGDKLLALRESQDNITPTALVSLDPETGKETPFFYFDLPAEAETFTLIDFNDVLVQDGRLFFGAKSAIGPGPDQPEWVYLVLGIESNARKTP
ncbi:PQQ-binding-like beta-propeller repeat protein [Streptomyces sp. Z423-1]|uniref:outer membrane protein assembly factor BamB family protein n=1 Tax=unclassified Streptomyces TaxID=2593676 RepID=UPI001F0EFED6|nr:PQQ-binding-like beta-propeller repeat protein [Streptomyces sp. Z423-1]